MSFPFFIPKRVVQLYTMLVTMIAILLLLLGRTCHGATELPAPIHELQSKDPTMLTL